jgi:hypothetical protein
MTSPMVRQFLYIFYSLSKSIQKELIVGKNTGLHGNQVVRLLST